jgi:mono/diheme cytochrome c family protein
MARRIAINTVLASLVWLSGCGQSTADGQASEQPLPGHPGAAPYSTYCASCHGAELRGTDQGPSHLSIVYEPGHHPDWSFEVAIREGVRAHHWPFGDMAPVDGITDDEIVDVIAYVRAVQDDQGFEPYPPG